MVMVQLDYLMHSSGISVGATTNNIFVGYGPKDEPRFGNSKTLIMLLIFRGLASDPTTDE